MVKEEYEFDNIHSFRLKCLMRSWKFVQFIWIKTQKFLHSQRLFAKHHTRSSLCRIFHGRSLSYKFVFNLIQFFVYCCHSNVDFTSNYILPTFNPKSVGVDNLFFIVIGFFTILKSLKGRLKKTAGMLKGYDLPMESTKGVPFMSLTFFLQSLFSRIPHIDKESKWVVAINIQLPTQNH